MGRVNLRGMLAVFLGAAVAAWFGILWIRGTPVSWDHFWPFGTVLTFLTVLTAAFDRILWRKQPVSSWLARRPNLNGTWAARLESTWIDPATGRPLEPIEAYVAVRQTFFSLQMHLMTRESESWLVAHSIVGNGDRVQVFGVYTNEPQIALRGNRSEIHHGAFRLQVRGDNMLYPTSLDGHYWTDRNTRGSMRLENRKHRIYTRFSDAQAAFQPPQGQHA